MYLLSEKHNYTKLIWWQQDLWLKCGLLENKLMFYLQQGYHLKGMLFACFFITTLNSEEDKTFLVMQQEDSKSCSIAGSDKSLTVKKSRKWSRDTKALEQQERSSADMSVITQQLPSLLVACDGVIVLALWVNWMMITFLLPPNHAVASYI